MNHSRTESLTQIYLSLFAGYTDVLDVNITLYGHLLDRCVQTLEQYVAANTVRFN